MKFKKFFLGEAEVKRNTLEKIKNVIEDAGGEIFVVGGPVRDTVLGHVPKDIDFLVRLLSSSEISRAISVIGTSNEVGKRFGVIKGNIDGDEYDFAIPRIKETKTGEKHGDFEVETDPNAEVADDLGRRDFTWNAMVVPIIVFIEAFKIEKSDERSEFIRSFLSNPDNKMRFDPHDGLGDLDNGKLTTVGDPKSRFREDPMRMLRAIQFAARMGFNISDGTAEAIKTMLDKLDTLDGEGIREEFIKAWTKSKRDVKLFIELLDKLGVGKKLFGNGFAPNLVRTEGFDTDEERILANFVGFFLDGGEYMRLKPTNQMKELLLIAKALLITKDEEFPPFAVVQKAKAKDQLSILFSVFRNIDNSIAMRIGKMTNKPISGQELKLSGNDIISMGLEGKQIGKAMEFLLQKVWNDEIENNRDELEKLLKDNLKFLKKI